MRASAFFDANNIGYFEIYGVSARTGRGSIFRYFLRTSPNALHYNYISE